MAERIDEGVLTVVGLRTTCPRTVWRGELTYNWMVPEIGCTFPAFTWSPVPASVTVASNGTLCPDSALGAPTSRLTAVGTWSGWGITFTPRGADTLAETWGMAGVYSALT